MNDATRANASIAGMRVALVHDYLVHVRGGERVFRALAEAVPAADLYTMIHDERRMPSTYRMRPVKASFLKVLPARFFRAYLPLYPLAARSLDLSEYDLVVASSSAWAHGVSVGAKAMLVCYCHSPFRYIWRQLDSGTMPQTGVARLALAPSIAALRAWDRRAAARVDQYIANSRVVQQRIAACYGQPSVIIPPPVDVETFRRSDGAPGDYYLVVSALVPYKRVEIAVEAFTRLGLKLKVVGTGHQAGWLRSLAGPTVEFLGHRSDEEVARLYAECRALIVTANEDFGITPLEAMASGRPVIAFGCGGVTESVVDNVTGTFFQAQTADSLAMAVTSFDWRSANPVEIRRHAELFGTERFKARFLNVLDELCASKKNYGSLSTQT